MVNGNGGGTIVISCIYRKKRDWRGVNFGCKNVVESREKHSKVVKYARYEAYGREVMGTHENES